MAPKRAATTPTANSQEETHAGDDLTQKLFDLRVKHDIQDYYIKSLEDQLTTAQTDHQSICQQLTESETQIHSLKTQITWLEVRCLKITQADEQRNKAVSDYLELMSESETLRSDKGEIERELIKARNEISMTNNEKKALTAEIARLRNELASSQASLDEKLRARDTSYKQMSDRCTSWKNKHDDLSKIYNESFITSGEWSQKYYEIGTELAEVRKQRDDFEKAAKNASVQRDEALTSLQAMKSDVHDIASQTTALATKRSELEKKEQELEGKQSVYQQDQAKLVKDQTYLKGQQDFHEEAARKLDSQKVAVIKREVLVAEKEKRHAQESFSLDIAKKAHKSKVDEFALKQRSLEEDAEKLRSEINELSATVDALDRREKLAQDAQKNCEQKHEDLSAKYEVRNAQLIDIQARYAEKQDSILEKIDELTKLRTQLESTKKEVENLQSQLMEVRNSAEQATSQHRETTEISHSEAVSALNLKHANEIRILNSQIKTLNDQVTAMTRKEYKDTQENLNLSNDLRERDNTISSHVENIEKLQEELKNNNTRVEDLERNEQDLHEHNERQQIERASLEATIKQLERELGAALQHLENIVAGPEFYCNQQKLREAATTLPSTTLEDDFTKDYHLDPQDISTDWSLSMVSEQELLPFSRQSFPQLTTRLYLSAGVPYEYRAIQAMLEVMLQKPAQCDSRDLPLLISLVHKLLRGMATEANAMFAVRAIELIEWKPKVRPGIEWAKYMLIRAHVSWLDLWAEAVNKIPNATSSVVPLSRIWMSNSGIPAIDNDTLTYPMPELNSVEEEVPEGSFRSPRTLFANRIDSSANFYAIVDAQARWIVVYPESEGEVDGDGLNTLPQRCRINGKLSDVPDFELPIHDQMFVERNMRALSGRSLRLWRERKSAEEKRSQGTR
ncbi:hypothetical protein KCU78_g2524, partial [Aureobasidium melanogenum]